MASEASRALRALAAWARSQAQHQPHRYVAHGLIAAAREATRRARRLDAAARKKTNPKD